MSARRGFALVAAIAIACVASARAQPEERSAIEVELEPPARLVVGARAEVIAHVRLGEDAGRPMLLTPATEGTAVEVVRGRLTRADADAHAAEDATELRFRIPIVARMVGTAVLRVRVDGFACRDGRCRALQIEESVAIDVRGPE